MALALRVCCIHPHIVIRKFYTLSNSFLTTSDETGFIPVSKDLLYPGVTILVATKDNF